MWKCIKNSLFKGERRGFSVTVCYVFTLKYLIQWIPSTSQRKPLYMWEKRRLASEALVLQRSCFLFRFVGWSLLAFKLVVVFCRRQCSAIMRIMCLLGLRLLMESFKDWRLGSRCTRIRFHPSNQPAQRLIKLQFNSISVTLEIRKIVFKFFYEGMNWNMVNDMIESEMTKQYETVDCCHWL